MALQQAHATSISRQVVIVGEGSPKLGVLFSAPPFSFFDMLLVKGVLLSAPPLSFLDMLLVTGIWVNDFFPCLLLAHLVEGFYFLTWMCLLSFCSLVCPFVWCFVLLKFGRVSTFHMFSKT